MNSFRRILTDSLLPCSKSSRLRPKRLPLGYCRQSWDSNRPIPQTLDLSEVLVRQPKGIRLGHVTEPGMTEKKTTVICLQYFYVSHWLDKYGTFNPFERPFVTM